MVEYLDLVLSEGQVEMDPIKISGVRDWLTPKNITEVQAVLCGLCKLLLQVHPRVLTCSQPSPSFDQEGRTLAMDPT